MRRYPTDLWVVYANSDSVIIGVFESVIDAARFADKSCLTVTIQCVPKTSLEISNMIVNKNYGSNN